MSRVFHTLSTFGFGAAATVGLAVIHPASCAIVTATVLLAVALLLGIDTGGDAASKRRSGR